MKENPWTKKHPVRRVVTIRTPERVREDLFVAGWRPRMAGLPVTDGRIRELLLELNQANRNKTMRLLRRYEQRT